MFGLDFGEILIIVIAALIFIKPGDLPGAMQEVARWLRKLQTMAGEFHRHVDDMMKESGLDQVKKQVDEIRSLNPTNIVQDYIDPKGEIRNALTPPDFTSPPSTTTTPATGAATPAPPSEPVAPAPSAPLQPIVFGPQAAPGIATPPVASNASAAPAQQASA